MRSERPAVREVLRAALTEAMRARDRPATTVYRSALAALDNAAAVPVDTMPGAGAIESSRLGVGAAEGTRRELGEDEQRAVIQAEIDECRSAAGDLARHDAARATGLVRDAALLERVLQ